MTDLIFENALLPDGTRAAFAVTGGRIEAILPPGAPRPEAGGTVDFAGALVAPGFVEGHIHLDTSFWGDAWFPYKPCTDGFDVHERVAFQHENLAQAAPLAPRARSQLELCLAHGSTRMRSHLMIDLTVGLSHVETLLSVREEYAGLIDLQLCAFPQNGILHSPGVAGMMDAALEMGCEVVGGLDPATFDRDVEGHLDAVFDLAERRGAPVDIHLHDTGTLGVFEIERICERTVALGMQGRVGVSHAYGLGDVDPTAQRKAAERIAAAGVAIMTTAPGARNFPPVALLREAGATVWSGCDNIRDSWSPYGDGDMLGRARMIGYRSGFNTDAQLAMAFDVVTEAGAKALGLADYGFRPGAAADFVTIPAAHVPEAVAGAPGGREVWKNGRRIAAGGRLLAEVSRIG
ncbi:amidohydrolase family protein [Albimonas pacifica]|uniref:Cytosine deaminase n=1 Tax=Albimonas pacifica TaxID=1114924 RepID=A0A1I3KW83_9RHOB|nr:amidohydrolase family protein [Albimonas pacifica]SFI76588.1 cytosine deaminase [Albimonas pacifica]